jgi:hypothetical protein
MDEREQDMGPGEQDLGPKEIARLDKARYKEPGRDLMATKPAEPLGEGGARGDVDNPVAGGHSHGGVGPAGDGLVGSRGERHVDRKRRK